MGGNSHWRTPPTASERRFEGARHAEPTPQQVEHEHRAAGMPEQRMGSNHGMPPTAATPRPSGFGEPQVERARPAPEMRAQPVRPAPAMRPQGGEPHAHPGQRQGGERGGRHDGEQH